MKNEIENAIASARCARVVHTIVALRCDAADDESASRESAVIESGAVQRVDVHARL